MEQVQSSLEIKTVETEVPEKTASPMKEIFGNRDFRLLWLGEAISLLGDQFHMIALPWLVLQLTGDAFLMGTVLALAAVPRAIFMLIGGAITDRYSPRNVMLMSNLSRMVLVTILTGIILTGAIELWMIYILSFLFGLADAFYFPASQAIVPSLVSKTVLQAANSIVYGTAQLSVFLGPVIAGVLISLLSANAASGDAPDMRGIGIAFGIDTLTFAVSAFTLWLMSATKRKNSEDVGEEEQSVIQSVREGFSYLWNDKLMRKVFIVSVWINFFLVGPLTIGIPVLADTQYAEGAAAFGIIMSGFGAGAFIGIILAGVLPRPKPRYVGAFIMGVLSLMGIGEIILVVTNSTAVAVLAMAIAAAGNAWINVIMLTWLQSVAPENMMGRLMSVTMFAGIGVTPFAHILTGFLLEISPLFTFSITGILVIAIAIVMLRDKDIATMGYAMAEKAKA